MKVFAISIPLAALLLAVAWAQQPANKTAGEPERNADSKSKAAKPPSLCKSGFIFIELVTDRVAEYISFFEQTTDFKVSRNDGGYACMRTGLAELVFMERQGLPEGHPNKRLPGDTGRGLGIEIVVIVPDLDRSFAKVAEFKQRGWKLSAGIGRRPWGARDFRVVSPDGYYLRFSEPM